MKRSMKAFPAMAWRIIALVMAMWLIAMAVLTWAVAADFYNQLVNLTEDYARMDHTADMVSNSEYPAELPGTQEAAMLQELGDCYIWMRTEKLLPFVGDQKPGTLSSESPLWGKWNLCYGFEAAEVFRDENGSVLMESGNLLSFVYVDNNRWVEQVTEPIGRGYIDLDEVPGGAEAFSQLIFDFPYGDFTNGSLIYMLRMTGRFEGNRFCPVTIDRGFVSGAVEDIELLCGYDADNKVKWENLITAPEGSEGETVTIYTWENSGILAEYTPVTLDGNTYASMTELAEEEWSLRRMDLLESIIITTRSDEGVTYTLGIRCWPLQYALLRLWHVYLISLVVAAFFTRLVLSKIHTAFARPVSELAKAVDWGLSFTPDSDWQELRMLEEHFIQTRKEQAESNSRIAQLETALDYAKNAEENRRQLISNITHELKTPLAVIHSYAEGLQMGIAEGKRDQYLATILEETERMDSMVLQMLDLSRLEAGKVRLTMTQFSLLSLTKTVVEKLSPMLEAKELELSYDFVEEFQITADEGRMEQVITNLMTNALKYTPAGGRIGIKVYTHKRTVRFLIENTSGHLSQEALTKVFDSFYRADPSRTEPGTGLGLTLVKSIVELHGGSCSVRNTTYAKGKSAVEFGFILPMA